MKHFLLVFSLLFPAVSFSHAATATTDAVAKSVAPDQVIKQTGEKLFSRIANSQQELEKFPELMRDIVEEELMPAIDYKYASFKILGKHLRKTTPEQREKFVNSMRHYLVKTYANALNQYTNQQVIYGKSKVKGKQASVSTIIRDTGKPDIKLVFQMRKNKKTGQWKAYDMIVEGISLLSSKQAEFNSRINKFGIDQVTVELAAFTK